MAGAFIKSKGIADIDLMSGSAYALYVALGFRSVMNFKLQLSKVIGVFNNIDQRIGLRKQLDSEYQNQPFLSLLKPAPLPKAYPLLSKQVCFKNVRYSYPETNSPILQNCNFTFESGKVYAIAGDSGTGKSTILNLLAKIQQPEGGTISIGGWDLGLVDDRFLQEHVSYLTQDKQVVEQSFRYNILYGSQGFNGSDERIEECLRMADCYQLVKEKGGLDAKMSRKGSSLSGGQVQRLLLCRALIKSPFLLILDEATANLDPQSQKSIMSCLSQNKADRVTIIICHKLDNVRQYIDQVVPIQSLR